MTSLETVAEQRNITTVILADVPVAPELSLQGWADRVTQASGQAVEAIIAVGRLLLAAKKALRHGEWERLFKGHPNPVAMPVRFSVTMAKMYMAIAVHPVLANRNFGNDLPPSCRTLYELTFLPEQTLSQLIADGVITPELRRADAVALRYAVSSPPSQRMSRKHVADQLRDYADSIECQEVARTHLFRYATDVANELAAPLQIGEDGRIQSGVWWVPPFASTLPLKVRPCKVLHQCECGHVHEDRRTKA